MHNKVNTCQLACVLVTLQLWLTLSRVCSTLGTMPGATMVFISSSCPRNSPVRGLVELSLPFYRKTRGFQGLRTFQSLRSLAHFRILDAWDSEIEEVTEHVLNFGSSICPATLLYLCDSASLADDIKTHNFRVFANVGSSLSVHVCPHPTTLHPR